MDTIRPYTVDTRTRYLVDAVREIEYPLATSADLEPLMEKIGDANYVLLGEASHGTSDYYTWRAHLSKRLIQEKGFSFIAVEGDWPDCYRLNRFIKGNDEAQSAYEVLHTFRRWPTWMWANWEIVALGEHYYRTMLGGSAASWNVHDYHMANTLDRLMDHYGSHAKAIVWEHNTHIGDARATDMSQANMVNVGQIVRERHQGAGVILVGFGSQPGHCYCR